jgi:hypothetical protein
LRGPEFKPQYCKKRKKFLKISVWIKNEKASHANKDYAFAICESRASCKVFLLSSFRKPAVPKRNLHY